MLGSIATLWYWLTAETCLGSRDGCSGAGGGREKICAGRKTGQYKSHPPLAAGAAAQLWEGALTSFTNAQPAWPFHFGKLIPPGLSLARSMEVTSTPRVQLSSALQRRPKSHWCPAGASICPSRNTRIVRQFSILQILADSRGCVPQLSICGLRASRARSQAMFAGLLGLKSCPCLHQAIVDHLVYLPGYGSYTKLNNITSTDRLKSTQCGPNTLELE